MALPRKYVSQPAALANYNYSDIAEGTGVVSYYGYNTEDNSVKTYQLVTTALYSGYICTTGTGTTGAGAEKALTLDFDVMFNVPRDLKGNVVVQIPIISGNKGDGTKTCDCYCVVYVQKWDGATATTLGQNTKTRITSMAGGDNCMQFLVNAVINISSATHFKIGESLRIEVELWVQNQGAGKGQAAIMHDPANRDPNGDYTGGTDAADFRTSQFKVNVPFRLDIT